MLRLGKRERIGLPDEDDPADFFGIPNGYHDVGRHDGEIHPGCEAPERKDQPNG